MRYLLNIAYLLLLILASPWLLRAAWRHGKYRQGLRQKLWGKVPALGPHPQRIWFHAVSVGEVNLLEPILSRLIVSCPGVEIVISTTTQTGHQLAKSKFSPHHVIYCPLDFSWAVRNAMTALKPTLLVLVELELWPNLLLEAERRQLPVVIINGRLSDASFKGYRRILPFIRRCVRSIAIVTAQSPTCADRFAALGIPADRVHHVGSLKFDGAATDRNNPRTLALIEEADIQGQEVVFLAGSTQAPEELYALRAFARLCDGYPQLRLILVPRHPERFEEVAGLLRDSGLAWCRRSELGAAPPARILLVDVVGELGAWWGRADIGFVGGSMGKRGGQNMIEPAAYGVATSFGPNTKNFRDVVGLLLQREAAVVVSSESELAEFLQRCLDDIAYRRQFGRRAAETVLQQIGAADRTVSMLTELLCEAVSQPGNAENGQDLPSHLRRTA